MSTKDKTKQKIIELTTNLNKWNSEYYNDNVSSVDDTIFDKAMEELIKLEKQYPKFKQENSPTNKVGIMAASTFEKAEHSIKMLSLNKVNTKDELFHFFKQVTDKVGNVSYTVEPKIDGLSISIIYKNGKLDRALTRGDGIVGEDVTNNVLQVKSIPKTIEDKKELIIRGEIYLPITEWTRINKKRLAQDKEPFANPRNAAAGTLRQINPQVVKERNLSSFIFQVVKGATGENWFDTQEKTFKGLKDLGFKVIKETFKSNDYEKLYEKVIHLLDGRADNDYETDGVVIKVNENKYYDELGYTSKFPRWAIAYKPPSEVKETKLINIHPTIGRTGRVTYVASLEPVKFADTMVRKASLHNYDYISILDLRIGDTVQVKKAGEIIPKVISSIKNEAHDKNEVYPKATICPSCGDKLINIEGEVDQYCVNDNCPSRIQESLVHFASRDAMNIEGLSEKQISKFIEIGIVNSIIDIYRIKFEDLIDLEGYQKTSVNKLLASIIKSKDAGLDKLLFALGIRHIGKKSAKELAHRYKNIDALLNLNRDKLISDEDFAHVKAGSIVKWFNDETNQILIKELKDIGLKVTYERKKIKTSDKFVNKILVITGTINGFKREEAKEYFEALGAKVTTSVSSKTDILIVGENPSDKKINSIENAKIISIKSKDEL